MHNFSLKVFTFDCFLIMLSAILRTCPIIFRKTKVDVNHRHMISIRNIDYITILYNKHLFLQNLIAFTHLYEKYNCYKSANIHFLCVSTCIPRSCIREQFKNMMHAYLCKYRKQNWTIIKQDYTMHDILEP
jgi:hypothetical protein